jgi:hypothetical protein
MRLKGIGWILNISSASAHEVADDGIYVNTLAAREHSDDQRCFVRARYRSATS